MARFIQKLAGYSVTKKTLLCLLPLSFVCMFGTLVVAACYFPSHYDWTRRVMSDLTSQRNNRHYYWLPRCGLAIGSLLALPFAGYMERCLRDISTRVARAVGIAFAAGFCLLLIAATILPSRQPDILGVKKPHEVASRACVLASAIGMMCCCWCAFKDRRGKKTLPSSVALAWSFITYLPIGGLVIAGVILLGHALGQQWAEDARAWLRYTPMWHLAFWEWMGMVVMFAFMFVSVLLLPEPAKTSQR